VAKAFKTLRLVSCDLPKNFFFFFLNKKYQQ
jgi:hypothetical protein